MTTHTIKTQTDDAVFHVSIYDQDPDGQRLLPDVEFDGPNFHMGVEMERDQLDQFIAALTEARDSLPEPQPWIPEQGERFGLTTMPGAEFLRLTTDVGDTNAVWTKAADDGSGRPGTLCTVPFTAAEGKHWKFVMLNV